MEGLATLCGCAGRPSFRTRIIVLGRGFTWRYSIVLSYTVTHYGLGRCIPASFRHPFLQTNTAMTAFYAKVCAVMLCGLVSLTLVSAPVAAQDDDPGLRTTSSWAGGGAGIIEIAHPSGDPCAAPSTPGCLEYGGNTVWHDPSVSADYYVSAGGGTGGLDRLSRFIEAVGTDQFEMRFTASGGFGIYGFAGFEIISVPFELWNIGEPSDSGDDVRMIPFINANGVAVADWADMFTGVDAWPVSGGTPISDWVYWMMPDRADGYDMFEAAAVGFGGAGSIYDPLTDGDAQIDPDPFVGGDCATQGVFVNYCYRNQPFVNNGGPSSFIYPVGRMVFGDLAADGTTPETGTVLRLIAEGGGFPNFAGNGAGIVESVHPSGDPCAVAASGCAEYGGNTVWHDPNSTAEYYVGGGGGDGSLDRIRRFVETAIHDAFEMRFTATGGFGVYAFAGFTIATVPFELWNIGDPDDGGADDVRMIPFLNANAAELADWADMFTGVDAWPVSGGTPITDWVYWMMPDRADGYDMFETAAIGFGGAGAIYDPLTDGDVQIDPDPSGTSTNGVDCNTQGLYADYCYRNTLPTGIYPGGTFGSQFVYPIGRMVIADLGGGGTTPPDDTVIRLFTDKSAPPPPTANEDGPETPESYVLHAAYPNPFNPQAVVPFDVPEVATIRLAVFDMLGREVAELANGQFAAGRHEVVFNGNGLASGVYLIRMEAAGSVQSSMKVLLLR